ncbi:MAG: segregation and condensation protein A [Bacteroidia bacterium]|nr:MAG: segregation and condensation protein A [Bacteroidia bacterium]
MYTVKLTDFEGPLDLLLFFIKRDELDIYDIPIARITREFLDYVHYMESLDLEVAGEFVVMAAELMQIKVRMLLPPEPGEEEDEDPRANLVKRLVEYKRYKEVSEQFSTMEDERFLIHERGYREADEKILPAEEDDHSLRDVTLFDLIASFKFAMDRIPKKFVHEVIRLNVSIDEQIAFLQDFFARRSEATFSELIAEMTERIRVIVTFLALLELIRNRTLIVRQNDPFEELSIMRTLA